MSQVGERSSEAELKAKKDPSVSSGTIDDGNLVYNTVKNLPLILRLIKISFDQNISINIKGEQ